MLLPATMSIATVRNQTETDESELFSTSGNVGSSVSPAIEARLNEIGARNNTMVSYDIHDIQMNYLVSLMSDSRAMMQLSADDEVLHHV